MQQKNAKGQNVNLEWKRKSSHMRKIFRTEILLLDINSFSKHLWTKKCGNKNARSEAWNPAIIYEIH